MTNTLRSPTVASHPTMCAFSPDKRQSPPEKKIAIEAISSYMVVRLSGDFKKKNASHSLRVSWPVHPVIDPGNGVTG